MKNIVPVVIGGDDLLSPVGIGLTDLPNIRRPVAPLAPPVPETAINYAPIELDRSHRYD